jgi:hypothetical protein
MIQKAVIDRIIDKKQAVLLLGDKETEYILSIDRLPTGAKEGTWLKVKLSGSDIDSLEIDEKESTEVRNRINDKMELLKKRKGSLFKK